MLDITVGFQGIAEALNRLEQISTAAQVFGASSATVRSDLDYATYVEMGTRPHDIYPRNAKALFWEGARHPVGHVKHPGTSANPFMQRGLDEASGPISSLIASEFEQVVSGSGSNYTTIMDHAGGLLLKAVQQEAPVRTGNLRKSLYYVNGR